MFVQVVLVDTTPYLSLGFPLATVFYFIIYYLFVKTQYFVLLPMLTAYKTYEMGFRFKLSIIFML